MKLETLVWITLAVALMYACDVHGADFPAVECKTQPGDSRYWSWRIINGKQCWYPGRPNKPKHELRWSSPDTASKERERPREVHISPAVAPVEEEVMQDGTGRGAGDNAEPALTVEELLARAYDELREKLLRRR